MHTPVRVKGRKGSKKSSMKTLKRKREMAKLDNDQAHEVQQERFSTLETLPPEILESIFILSQNLALSLASTRLRTVLTSRRLIEKITLDLSTSLGLFATSGSSCAIGEEAELAFKSWQKCLRHPQFSFRWFELRTREMLIERARQLISDFWKETGTLLSIAERERQLCKIESAVYNIRLSEPRTRNLQCVLLIATKSILYSRQPVTLCLKQVQRALGGAICEVVFDWYNFFEPSGRLRLCGGPAEKRRRTGFFFPSLSRLWTFEKSVIPWFEVTELSTPFMYSRTMVPSFLYRAPFTQEKGNLLKFLIDRQMSIPNALSAPSDVLEAASVGLTEALRECCLPAIYCISPICLPINLPYEAADTFNWWDLFSRLPPSIDLASGNGYNPKPDAWKYLIGPSRQGRVDGGPWPLHVTTFTEDHLRACLENMHRNPRTYANFLSRMVMVMYCMRGDDNYRITSTDFLQAFDSCRKNQTEQIQRQLDTAWRMCTT